MIKVLIFYSPFSRTGSTSTWHIESNAGPTCDAVVGQLTNQQKRNRTFWPVRLTSNPFTFSTTILDVEVRPWLGFRRRRRKLHRPRRSESLRLSVGFPSSHRSCRAIKVSQALLCCGGIWLCWMDGDSWACYFSKCLIIEFRIFFVWNGELKHNLDWLEWKIRSWDYDFQFGCVSMFVWNFFFLDMMKFLNLSAIKPHVSNC